MKFGIRYASLGRNKVGTAILIQPPRNPVATPKAVASLDSMAGHAYVVDAGWR